MSDVVLNIKTIFSNDSISKANSEINKYIKGATGAADKADKFGKVQNQLNKAIGAMQNGLNKVNGLLGKFPMITGGVTLGLTSLIHAAWDMNKTIVGMQNELKNLSDASGSVNGAWNIMMNSWSNSIASLATIKGSMNALANAGMQVGPAMENLTTFVSNLHQASGLSAEKMGQLTGELHSYWNVSVQGSREVVSSILAAQKAFGSTTAQMEQFMGTVIEAQNRLGALSKDGEAGAKALTKGITMASGALVKMGVNAQTATSFIDKLMDPERFDETSGLLRRLGISIEEQFKMMETAGGKETFFDKLLTNLPKLAQEIQGISNPLARFRYAKGIGLPPEIAMKMASASGAQMRTIIEEYKSQAEGEKAAQEKQKRAQADAARFEEQIMFLKMKILSPMIQFVMQAYNRLQKYIPAITNTLQKVVGWIADGMSKVFDAITPVMDAITGKGNIGEAIGKSISNLVKVLMDAIHKNMPIIMKVMKEVIKGAITIFFQLFKEHPFLMSALVGGKAISGIGSMVTFAGTLKNLGVIKGLPGLGNLGKMLGGLGTKAGGLFAGGLGTAAKAAGPIGLAISALMGGFQGMKAMGPGATGAQKTGGALAGAGTLGIAPLIDSIFDTKITPVLGKNMKNLLLASPAAPAGILLHAFEAFESKVLKASDQLYLNSMETKRKAGKKLTDEELSRVREIGREQAKNHTTWAEGWEKFKKSMASVFEAGTWKDFGKKIGEQFEKVGHKIKMVVGKYLELPLFNFFFGFQILIEKALWKIKSILPTALGGITEAEFTERSKELENLERLGVRFKSATKWEDLVEAGAISAATRGAATGAGKDLHAHAELLKEIINEAKLARRVSEETRDASRSTAGSSGVTADATRALASRKTTEADFFKTFVGSYGLTSFSVKTT